MVLKRLGFYMMFLQVEETDYLKSNPGVSLLKSAI
jgi:hypothetical protein